MVQKIHDFRNAHTVNFSWHHFLAAIIVMVAELTIHELEMHLLAILTTVSISAKDIIRDLIEKCEGVCNVGNDDK